jgi:anti-sigma factor RsiW
MTCREVLDVVEAVAAGDLEPDAVLRAHLESCPRCASALASARRLETALAAWPAPPAPARFTPTVIAHIRRERWRTEQNVDRLFNVAIAVAVLLVAGGVLALLNLGGVIALASAGWTLLGGAAGSAVQQTAPAFGTYVAAVGLLVSALGMWWWAERRLLL